ncbi:MAG: o-succinylbenzoate--CoA ligase [Microbacteriaceae bacterium]|nr:o-succinylbenzoate--CoA ligase [Microbacteriaceae bacterium]
MAALRAALTADGPAVLPHPGTPAGVPEEVKKRVAVVIETSGSTGSPKRVALSADAMLANVAATDSSLGGAGQWLLALPTNYVAGTNVLVRSIVAGTEPVLLPDGHFDATVFAELSDRMDAELRFVSLVPTQLSRLVDAAEQDMQVLERVRRFDRILVGGQAAASSLLTRALELGLNVSTTYGSSETAGGCVYDGVPTGSVRVRITDGQVELGGAVLAEGYLGDPARTDAAFYTSAGERWYRTGDGGELRGGVLRITGRLDSVIISGGVKVSLDEVEQVVRGLPGLADAVVVRVPSQEWGEVPVVIAAGASATEAELGPLRNAVSGALSRAAAPAAVFVMEQIPLTPTGKPDRVALEAFAAGQALQH